MADDARRNWRKEYEDLVHRMEETQDNMRPVSRRANPRYHSPVETNQPASGAPIEYPILDVSVGGAAFLSTRFHESGSRISINIGNESGFEMEILGADSHGEAGELPGYGYKVRSRFAHPDDGFRAFVVFWDRTPDA